MGVYAHKAQSKRETPIYVVHPIHEATSTKFVSLYIILSKRENYNYSTSIAIIFTSNIFHKEYSQIFNFPLYRAFQLKETFSPKLNPKLQDLQIFSLK